MQASKPRGLFPNNGTRHPAYSHGPLTVAEVNGLAHAFISHDLAVVRFMADEVLVMKDGEVIEQAGVEQILDAPREDYTRRLLGAIPRGYLAPGSPAAH